MVTIRQQIFDAVVAQLRTVKTTNQWTAYGMTGDYLTNIGDQVHPWRTSAFQPEELPGVVPRDLDEPVEPMSEGSQRMKRQLHIQIVVAVGGEDAADQLRKIFGDLDIAVGLGRDSYWGNLASETVPRISRSVLDQESLKVAGGIYEFYIHYPTLAFNPFNGS